MPPLLLELLALCLYGPLVVLLHEGGHALFARPGGFRVTSFGVGLGRPLWRLPLRKGVVFHVDRGILLGGQCVAIPVEPPSPRRAWFHGGGVLVQLALALVLLALPDLWLIDRVESFNLLVAATNLVPFRGGGVTTDGWYLIDTLTGGRRAADVLPQRRVFERLAAREASVGSPLGRVYADLCVAWVDLLAGRPAAASSFFHRDPPEITVDPWIDALYHYVRSEWHRLEGRPLASVRTVRDDRAALGADLSEGGAALLAVAEARALIDLDAPAQALQTLARVAGVGGPTGRQASVVHLAATLDATPEDLEFATWRVVRTVHEAWLDPADTVLVLWEAAARLETHRRVQAARGARDAARGLATRTIRSAAPEDRPSLRNRMGQSAGTSTGPGRLGELER